MDEEIKEAAEEGFEFFGFKKTIMRGVKEAGFSVPSPIQQQAIPVILAGRDVVGQAHTGTGKTAAFGLPGLNAVKNSGGVEMLVITPTRELATQVSEELFRLGQFNNIKTTAIYGGQSYKHQIASVRAGAQVVVGTPGRLLDLLESGRLKGCFSPTFVVLDEADEMLDMGFLEDVQKIFSFLPEERQTLLFSATMPAPIKKLADKILKDPAYISVGGQQKTTTDIKQHYFVIAEHERDDAMVRLMDSLEPKKAIVFCRMKKEVDRLTSILASRGWPAQGLHGDMEQRQRERVIAAFRTGEVTTLVATDVAARGLDVADVTHVFNYHIPFDTDSYVHRIGRTGRAGRKGVAVTLCTPQEYHSMKRIQGKVGKIEHGFIPTHKDLRKVYLEGLAEEIRNQKADKAAEQLLASLQEEMEPDQVAIRLASLLLSREPVTGPDRIGITPAEYERLSLRLDPRSSGRSGGQPFRGGRGFKPGGRPAAGGRPSGPPRDSSRGGFSRDKKRSG